MPRSSDKKPSKMKSKRRLVFDDIVHSADEEAAGGAVISAPSSAPASSLKQQHEQPTPKRQKKRPGTIDAFASPIASTESRKTGAKRAVVTPEEKVKHSEDDTAEQAAETEDQASLKKYVPTYIHRNVGYRRQGESNSTLPETTLKVFSLICENYIIPTTFEQRRSYGPLSGTSYEERVIEAYSLGLLEPKKERKNTTSKSGKQKIIVCTSCAEIGHKRTECPSLI